MKVWDLIDVYGVDGRGADVEIRKSDANSTIVEETTTKTTYIKHGEDEVSLFRIGLNNKLIIFLVEEN